MRKYYSNWCESITTLNFLQRNSIYSASTIWYSIIQYIFFLWQTKKSFFFYSLLQSLKEKVQITLDFSALRSLLATSNWELRGGKVGSFRLVKAWKINEYSILICFKGIRLGTGFSTMASHICGHLWSDERTFVNDKSIVQNSLVWGHKYDVLVWNIYYFAHTHKPHHYTSNQHTAYTICWSNTCYNRHHLCGPYPFGYPISQHTYNYMMNIRFFSLFFFNFLSLGNMLESKEHGKR